MLPVFSKYAIHDKNSKIELHMLLWCCLIHKRIIILKHFLYLLYFSPCLGLGLFMSSLCDLFFISIFIFLMISV